MADDVIRELAVDVQLPTISKYFVETSKCLAIDSTMARSTRLSITDVLQCLDGSDLSQGTAEGSSDDDLGMDSDCEYDSDSSAEGIVYNKFDTAIVIKYETKLSRLGPRCTTSSSPTISSHSSLSSTL